MGAFVDPSGARSANKSEIVRKMFHMCGIWAPLATLGAAMGPIGETFVPSMCLIMASR